MADVTVPARGNVLGKLLPARYVLAILGSIAMAIIYGLKVNLSVGIVAMLNHTGVAESFGGKMPVDSSGDGPFIWSKGQQGLILASYFWGYFVSQIPGGKIAESYSAKWVMFFSVAINIVCTLLTPWAAGVHFGLFILMRVLEGIGGGVTFPGMHVMLASWAPPNERSVMSAIVYAGTALGTVISLYTSGVIADNLGWESIFYIMGGLSCIWLILWFILAADSPNKQRLISVEERAFITTELSSGNEGHGAKRPPVPWGEIFRSKPFWAILIAHFCNNFGWYMLLIELPIYLKEVHHLPMNKLAVATSVPFLTLWFFSLSISKTLDTLKAKGKITTTVVRKIATLCASLIPAACLLALSFEKNADVAVVLMGIGVTAIGGMFCGFLSNHIDLAPNYAGTLMSITNMIATIPGMTVPSIVGAVTAKESNMESWQIIFFITIGLYAIEIVVYTIFGCGEEQPWNKGSAGTRTAEDGGEMTPLNTKKLRD